MSTDLKPFLRADGSWTDVCVYYHISSSFVFCVFDQGVQVQVAPVFVPEECENR